MLGAWVSNLENLDDTLARLASHPVAEGMMQRNSVTADTPLQKLAELMLQDEVHHLVVTSGDKVDGVISRHDLAKLLLNRVEDDSELNAPRAAEAQIGGGAIRCVRRPCCDAIAIAVRRVAQV